MEADLQLIKNYEQDTLWLKSHKRELRKKYKNQFVAVENQNVVLADKNIDKLVRGLKKKGVEPSMVLVEFVPEEDVVVIY